MQGTNKNKGFDSKLYLQTFTQSASGNQAVSSNPSHSETIPHGSDKHTKAGEVVQNGAQVIKGVLDQQLSKKESNDVNTTSMSNDFKTKHGFVPFKTHQSEDDVFLKGKNVGSIKNHKTLFDNQHFGTKFQVEPDSSRTELASSSNRSNIRASNRPNQPNLKMRILNFFRNFLFRQR